MSPVGVDREKNIRNATGQISMISFVYFDVGGVGLLDFSETNKWNELKQSLGIIDAKQSKLFDQVWKRYRSSICINYDVDQILPTLQKEIGLNIHEHYSLLKDFVNRFEKNKTIWPVMNTIQKTCRVGLLTNMYPRMFQLIQQKELLPHITWDVVVDSSVVMLQKPDVRIFQYAEKESKVHRERILFVDNTLSHIEAARQFGMQVFHYDVSNPSSSSQKLLLFFHNNA